MLRKIELCTVFLSMISLFMLRMCKMFKKISQDNQKIWKMIKNMIICE